MKIKKQEKREKSSVNCTASTYRGAKAKATYTTLSLLTSAEELNRNQFCLLVWTIAT